MFVHKTIRCTKCGLKVIKSTCDDDGYCVACQIDKPVRDSQRERECAMAKLDRDEAN